MIRNFLRLIYPPKCIFCGTIVENDRFAVCAECTRTTPENKRACAVCGTPLDTIYGPLLCTTCAKKKRPFQRAYVPFVYKDAVRSSILGFKFGGKRARAVTFAAYMLLKMRAQGAERPDVITFVPLHFIRLGMRGYNQAALLAYALGDMLDVPALPLLRKKHHTPPQSKRSKRERQNALRDAFSFRKEADIRGKRILLIDDVITTGATLSACARILRQNGAKHIEIATIAATANVAK